MYHVFIFISYIFVWKLPLIGKSCRTMPFKPQRRVCIFIRGHCQFKATGGNNQIRPCRWDPSSGLFMLDNRTIAAERGNKSPISGQGRDSSSADTAEKTTIWLSFVYTHPATSQRQDWCPERCVRAGIQPQGCLSYTGGLSSPWNCQQ